MLLPPLTAVTINWEHEKWKAHRQNRAPWALLREEVNGKKYSPNNTNIYFCWSIQGISCVVLPSAILIDLSFLNVHRKVAWVQIICIRRISINSTACESFHRIPKWFGLEGTTKLISFHPSPWAGVPSTIPGCAKPCATLDTARVGCHSFSGQRGPVPQHPHS